MFFDATSQDTSILNKDCLPAGDYKVTVDGLLTKNTKSGTGRYIAATFSVASGTYAGRKVFTNFNIQNENELAEKIGKAQFALFLKAVGKATLADENDLLTLTDKVLMVKLSQKKDDVYGPKNELVKCWAVGEQVAVPQAMRSMSVDDLPF